MVSVQEGTLDRRRLDQVLWHVSRAKGRTTRLGAEFSLDIDPFLKENTFQERVLVAQHQTLICSMTVGGLQVVEILLMDTDGLFQLLDVLGSPLTEGRLSLAVALFPLLRSCIDLRNFISQEHLLSACQAPATMLRIVK